MRAIPSNSEDSEKSFGITQKSHPCKSHPYAYFCPWNLNFC